MNGVYLLTGGNIGDREDNLKQAKNKISHQCGNLVQESAIYETEAWGLQNQSLFLNQALKIETVLDAVQLLQCILGIEKSMGRTRENKYGPRTIDIDILLFNQQVATEPGLTIPHPRLHNRRFALQCLNDIAASEIHPLFNKTIQQLLQQCTDPLHVYKFEMS